jgi:cytochrome c556
MTHKLSKHFFIFGIVGVSLVVGSARADQQNVEDIISGRRSNLKDLGSAYKELGDELKKNKPMSFLVQQYVSQISDLSQQQQNWFPANTGPKSGIETKAKEEIWTRAAEFSAAMQAFQKEAASLAAIAPSDTESLKAQHKKLGQTCKACHDTFREKED